MKKFHFKKSVCEEESPTLLRLERRHTLMNVSNDDLREPQKMAAHVGSSDCVEMNNLSKSTESSSSGAKRRFSTKSLSHGRISSECSPASSVVITDTDLSSSWIYKNKKAAAAAERSPSVFERSPSDPLSPRSAKSPRTKSPRLEKGKSPKIPLAGRKTMTVPQAERPMTCYKYCCCITLMVVVCLCSIGIMSSIGGIIYLEIFSGDKSTPSSGIAAISPPAEGEVNAGIIGERNLQANFQEPHEQPKAEEVVDSSSQSVVSVQDEVVLKNGDEAENNVIGQHQKSDRRGRLLEDPIEKDSMQSEDKLRKLSNIHRNSLGLIVEKQLSHLNITFDDLSVADHPDNSEGKIVHVPIGSELISDQKEESKEEALQKTGLVDSEEIKAITLENNKKIQRLESSRSSTTRSVSEKKIFSDPNAVASNSNAGTSKSDPNAEASNSDPNAQASNSDRNAQASNSDRNAQASNSDRNAQASNSDRNAQASNSDPNAQAENANPEASIPVQNAELSNQNTDALNPDPNTKASDLGLNAEFSNSDLTAKASNEDLNANQELSAETSNSDRITEASKPDLTTNPKSISVGTSSVDSNKVVIEKILDRNRANQDHPIAKDLNLSQKNSNPESTVETLNSRVSEEVSNLGLSAEASNSDKTVEIAISHTKMVKIEPPNFFTEAESPKLDLSSPAANLNEAIDSKPEITVITSSNPSLTGALDPSSKAVTALNQSLNREIVPISSSTTTPKTKSDVTKKSIPDFKLGSSASDKNLDSNAMAQNTKSDFKASILSFNDDAIEQVNGVDLNKPSVASDDNSKQKAESEKDIPKSSDSIVVPQPIVITSVAPTIPLEFFRRLEMEEQSLTNQEFDKRRVVDMQSSLSDAVRQLQHLNPSNKFPAMRSSTPSTRRDNVRTNFGHPRRQDAKPQFVFRGQEAEMERIRYLKRLRTLMYDNV